MSHSEALQIELPPAPEIPATPKSPESSEVSARKLPRSMMRSFAARQVREQGGRCIVCGGELDLSIKGEGVIDHCHTTGLVRGVLHRSCNAALGKVDNAAGRWGAKSMNQGEILKFLRGMIAYYERPKLPWIYPTHRTPDERKDEQLKKRREAAAALRAKREVARQARLKGPE